MEPADAVRLRSLNAIMEYNAQIMAYANDFLFMFFISLPACSS